MRLIVAAILAAAGMAPLGGCGQKGPLVLPPPPPTTSQSKAPPSRPADRPFPDVPATHERQ
jgi:predicted small lipoprotein YifL